MVSEVYVIEAKRTAIGSFGKSLKPLSAIDLGEAVTNELFRPNDSLRESVDDVYFGNVFKSGLKGNPARQIGLRAGLPVSATAMTVDHQCASGMMAMIQAMQKLSLGLSQVAVAGGTESMSNVPHLLMEMRNGVRLGEAKVEDALLHDGLVCAMENYHMGVTAENLVDKYNLSRKEQDAFALRSQEKAAEAIASGRFEEEIVPVTVRVKGKDTIFNQDEHPRATSLEKLGQLGAAFKEGGSVTAGNASGLNDGAAALLLASKEAVEAHGLKPLAKIVSASTRGVPPAIMGIGPVPAILHALDQAGLAVPDIDLFEINEAFASQVLAVNTELNIPEEKLNVNGGAIALGHPVGASGARILVTLVHELKRRGQRYGVASLCVGGGQGAATVVEVV
ncbi:thiolase family protein [Bhargavaea massiliensis]|uniref:thiolase family protein n=1 Tax=Bhargavaea massiliensis TaxID=2697500 RepID=UPI001BD0F4C5|nr:thiolase family protein [Bhargavaea massiliensis]